MKSIVIDVHAHFTPKLLIEKFDGTAAKFPDVKLLKSDKGVAIQFPGIAPTRPIMPKLSDLAERQSWMDKNGIDHQVIGGWLDSFGYELPAAQGAAWSRFLNDCMWEQFRDERRFSPLATVPLQDGKLAAEILGESIERGFAGVMIEFVQSMCGEGDAEVLRDDVFELMRFVDDEEMALRNHFAERALAHRGIGAVRLGTAGLQVAVEVGGDGFTHINRGVAEFTRGQQVGFRHFRVAFHQVQGVVGGAGGGHPGGGADSGIGV